MDDPPLNPAEQVERIREILVGRQLGQIEERLRLLEESVRSQPGPDSPSALDRIRKSQVTALQEIQNLHQQLRHERQERRALFEQLGSRLDDAIRDSRPSSSQAQTDLANRLEQLSTAMAARIDARIREVFHHLQDELVQWKNQLDRDLQLLRDQSVSRLELTSRFARLANAAMEDDSASRDGFAL